MIRKKGNFLGYNTLKGRLIFTIFFSLLIIVGIKIIDSKSLHQLNLNFRDGTVGKYLDAMSIFVFVYGMLFLMYGSLGVYDAITYMTSKNAYGPKFIFILMIIFGVLQAFTGIDTIGRLFEMNGLLVARQANIYDGSYLFASAIKAVIYSLIMYGLRMLTVLVMRKKHDKLMRNNHELRERKIKLKEFFQNE